MRAEPRKSPGRLSLRARARRIRLLLFDVDGVLTDGVIWFFPSDSPDSRAVAGRGEGVSLVELKGFSAHDGIGMMLARQAGLKTGVITKRRSASLALRARDLRMDYVYQAIDDKLQALEEILRRAGVQPEETACMGDDIVDLPMMRACGLAAAPANARPEVKQAADWVATSRGGEGAARDLVELILKAQGRWREVLEGYLKAHASRHGQGREQ